MLWLPTYRRSAGVTSKHWWSLCLGATPTQSLRSAEALAAGIASPLLDLASRLYGETVSLGNSRQDMISVLQAIEARSEHAHPRQASPTTDQRQTTDSPSDSTGERASTGHLS